MISIIAAVDRKRGIGYQNRLLFWLPNDLKRFKALTTGNTIIMGRKTFESLPKGALPNRRNVVLSTQKDLICPDAEVFSSLEEALNSCQPDEHVYIIGGASVYRQALPFAGALCLRWMQKPLRWMPTFPKSLRLYGKKKAGSPIPQMRSIPALMHSSIISAGRINLPLLLPL